jgi:hypothetical protein
MWFGAEQARETDPVEPARRQARGQNFRNPHASREIATRYSATDARLRWHRALSPRRC